MARSKGTTKTTDEIFEAKGKLVTIDEISEYVIKEIDSLLKTTNDIFKIADEVASKLQTKYGVFNREMTYPKLVEAVIHAKALHPKNVLENVTEELTTLKYNFILDAVDNAMIDLVLSFLTKIKNKHSV